MRTAATLAAEMDRPHCLKRLVELNADLNVPDNDGDTPILKICGKNGNSATLQVGLESRPTWEKTWPLLGYVDFISCGYDINHQNKDGENAVMIAVQHNNTHLIRPLAARGIDLACRDRKGNCAIHYAVLGNRPEALQELLDLGVDVDCPQSGTGDTPAHLAIIHPGPEYKYECLRVLVRNGANLNLTNSNYSSASAFEISYPVTAAELAAVQRSRGYPHAHQVIAEAIEAGPVPRPTVLSAVATVGESTYAGLTTLGEHVTEAAYSTGEVLMMPISSIAGLVSSPPSPPSSSPKHKPSTSST